jgi:predicted regulator of Ras-like GTPase activity (Roadblock/LC7/MglB family)
MTEYGNGYLLTMSAGASGCLVVLADPRCDLGTVSYEMTALVNRVGDALVPNARGPVAVPAGRIP